MQIIQDRRELHKIPELVRTLPKTMAYLNTALSGLSCKVFSPMDSSLCAFFDFGADHAIAFRSDADALAVTEQTGLPFASTHPGKMHACGHDGHMAILLELARRLDKKEKLPHNVLLVFQPAEEEGAGAKDLCDTGIFEKYNVSAIFALHLWPGLAAGQIASRKGEMLSHSCEVTVDVYGQTAHIAKSKESLDALAAATEFYSRLRQIEMGLPKEIYRLLNFGLFQSGTVRNVLSGHVHIEGSLRAFQDDVFETLYNSIYAVAQQVQETSGCRFEILMNDGYPPVINPAPLFEKVRSLADFEELKDPFMIAEDFSWYQKRLPGMFFFLGVGDTPPLHAKDFTFDETILLKGAEFFEHLAENFQ